MPTSEETDATKAVLAELEHTRGKPWLRCPSTHCERRGECGHPKDCEARRLPPPTLTTRSAPVAPHADRSA